MRLKVLATNNNRGTMSEDMSEGKNVLAARLDEIHAIIKALEEEKRSIYAKALEGEDIGREVPEFMLEVLARPAPPQIEFPITIRGVAFGDRTALVKNADTGRLVKVRPCSGEQTYIGVMIGDVSLGSSFGFNRQTQVATIRPSYGNPVMWVPALGRFVLGVESWWGTVEAEDDMHDITDEDIANSPGLALLRRLTGDGAS
ncbi:MAG: hypothetical protein KC766_08290 [Myxococcales bacterium]|nr:hypothetical protein [Myxococcales bacterium]